MDGIEDNRDGCLVLESDGENVEGAIWVEVCEEKASAFGVAEIGFESTLEIAFRREVMTKEVQSS